MKLYNSNYSPNCLRVRAVALELGIDLDTVEVNILPGSDKNDEFLALNTGAKVPVLVDGDFVLFESRAINSYLAALRPDHGLYPENAKARAIVDQWSYWQTVHLGPAMQKVAFERFVKVKFNMGEPNEEVVASELKNVHQFLDVLQKNIAGNDWVAGNLSVADFAVASTFTFRQQAGISLDSTPDVAEWIERLEARESWQAAVKPLLALMEG